MGAYLCRRALAVLVLLTTVFVWGLSVSHARPVPDDLGSNVVSSPFQPDKEMSIPDTGTFKYDPALRPQVEFWKSIYSHYNTTQVVIHDREHMGVTFEILDYRSHFKNGTGSSRSRRNLLRNRVSHYRNALISLWQSQGAPQNAEQQRIVEAYQSVPGSYHKYKKAASNVRGQLGQADRFKAGLIRSGRHLKHIQSVLKRHGVPVELCALPHVESSFNYQAYSSVGAAGIWQFMRGTGRLFMQVGYTIDERRDPIIATEAAARLLKQNYEELGSWPLAITAYNHGVNGMKRAKRLYGDDIVKIINNHEGRTFGFASKNFYTEFLAALEVARDYKTYFGELPFEAPFTWDEVRLDHYVPAHAVASASGVDIKTLQEYNLALRQSVWNGNRHIPKGYVLKVPFGRGKLVAAGLENLPARFAKSEQKDGGTHIVRRGDTLSTIAARYRVSLRSLREVNDQRSHIIRVGQRLRIPTKDGTPARSRTISTAPPIAPAEGGVHVVQGGDTLYRIARANKTSVERLKRLNNLSRGTIYPGQRLQVEKGEDRPQVASVAPVSVSVALEPEKIETEPVSGEGDALDAKLTEEATVGSQAPVINKDEEFIEINGRRIGITRVEYGVRSIDSRTGEIIVDAEETLGHIAEWLDTTGSAIQRLNRRNLRRSMRIGMKVRIPLGNVSSETFTARRFEYHMQLLEDFFQAYKIGGEKTVKVNRGESLWELCQNEEETPLWLVRLYNRDSDLDSLRPGDTLTMPVVEKK